MIRITDSERKAILKKYPDAWLTGTKHHTMLSGHEDTFTFRLVRSLRGEEQKPRPAQRDGRQQRSEQHNRKPRRG